MRLAIVTAAAMLASGCTFRHSAPPVVSPTEQFTTMTVGEYLAQDLSYTPGLCFVDEKETNCKGVLESKGGRFGRLQVVGPSSALSRYGPRGKDGAIIAFTK